MRVDGVDGGDSIEERKRALLRAREHNLDVNRVAVVAAERSVEKAFEVRYFSCPLFEFLFLPAPSTNINQRSPSISRRPRIGQPTPTATFVY